MNREERRAYLKRMRDDQASYYCPYCNGKTRHFTKPSEKEHEVDIICECCGTVVQKGLTGYPPYICVKDVKP